MATKKGWQDEATIKNWFKNDPEINKGGAPDRPELQFLLDAIIGRTSPNTGLQYNYDRARKALDYDITTPDPITPPVVTPLTPIVDYKPNVPIALDTSSILEQLNKPTSDIVSQLLMQQAPLISKEVMKNVSAQQANAQSGFMQRGLTGSSTELGTLFKDIPAAANESIANALTKTMLEAYPLALQEKSLNTGTLISLRKLVTDEQYNSMSLEQKQMLANQDAQLKLTLQQIEQNYDRDKTAATMEFTAAQNEADRAIARRKLVMIDDAYSKQRQNAFFKSVTTLAGAGLGFASGGGWAGAKTGAEIGGATGGVLEGLFGM